MARCCFCKQNELRKESLKGLLEEMIILLQFFDGVKQRILSLQSLRNSVQCSANVANVLIRGEPVLLDHVRQNSAQPIGENLLAIEEGAVDVLGEVVERSLR